MTLTDYIIDILLISLIFRQMRRWELTIRAVLLPVGLIAAARRTTFSRSHRVGTTPL